MLCWSIPFVGWSQSIDHWEAVVLAENQWRYRAGNPQLPDTWNQPGFNDMSWDEGNGGFGYGDGDDNTIVSPTISLYLRKEFTLTNTAAIAALTLYADYDDAFVAYLNGEEIARANVGTPGTMPAYDEPSITWREAEMYEGGLPDPYIIPMEQLEGMLQSGTNTLAIQVHNTGVNSSDLSALFFLIAGVTDESMAYQPVPDWFVEPFTSSNLPVLVIDTQDEEIPDEPKIDGQLGIIDNGPGQLNALGDSFNGYNGQIGIELRGSSSLFFDKKSYSVETRLSNGDNNNVSLLGMPEENDWVLYGPFSDKSLMRNVLSFHIGRSMGRYAPRTRWCELLINGEYQGVYVLMEKIKRDNDRVDIARLRSEDIEGDELTGGYIFSVDRDEQGPSSGWDSPYTDAVFYKYQDPDYDELLPVQKSYIRNHFTAFETAMDQNPSAATYDQYLDIPSFVDYWIATEIFKHIDNFKLSFYMYKRKDSNGGKIHFGPLWDLNLAYGNFDFAQDPGPEGWSYIWVNLNFLRPFWVLDLSNDPALQEQINCRWNALRDGPLHTDSLLQFIDDNATLLADAQVRNFDRWPVLGEYVWPNSFVGNTYEEEVDFLKDWLVERLDWMDSNMIGTCTTASTADPEKRPTLLNVFPNPFQDAVTFYLTGTSHKQGQLVIYNVLGQPLQQYAIQRGIPTTYALQELTAGMYIYQLHLDGKVVETGKLIRE